MPHPVEAEEDDEEEDGEESGAASRVCLILVLRLWQKPELSVQSKPSLTALLVGEVRVHYFIPP